MHFLWCLFFDKEKLDISSLLIYLVLYIIVLYMENDAEDVSTCFAVSVTDLRIIWKPTNLFVTFLLLRDFKYLECRKHRCNSIRN